VLNNINVEAAIINLDTINADDEVSSIKAPNNEISRDVGLMFLYQLTPVASSFI
jgi:hypothetical protein